MYLAIRPNNLESILTTSEGATMCQWLHATSSKDADKEPRIISSLI